MAAATKKKKKRKEEAYPWKTGASSGHITNLKQSILEIFNIYSSNYTYRGKDWKCKHKNCEEKKLNETCNGIKLFTFKNRN